MDAIISAIDELLFLYVFILSPYYHSIAFIPSLEF